MTPLAILKVDVTRLDRVEVEWLAEALSMIACEYLKGEHHDSAVLHIYPRERPAVVCPLPDGAHPDCEGVAVHLLRLPDRA